ncbi:GTP-binding protein Rho1 [Ceratobasidium sp. 394]|nr:GTP-binding protein Rho1 [Ceratobasidium sp. 394]
MSEPRHEATASSSSRKSIVDVIQALATRGCPDITHRLDPDRFSEYPLYSGGFGEIYSGCMKAGGTKVAVKCARHHIQDDQNDHNMRLIAREIHAWAKCDHENVLELFGLTQHRGKLAVVSPWMENGNLRQYLTKNPDADRLDLCLQVTKGLAYLHQCEMVHGDLKGANVLISETGVAKLADFGNTRLGEQTLQLTTRTSTPYSLRWAAPEILENSPCSMPADIYALGMTIYETVTGNLPYADKADMVVPVEVLVHRRFPSRNDDLILVPGNKDRLWQLMTECWNHTSSSRPQAVKIVSQLSILEMGESGHPIAGGGREREVPGDPGAPTMLTNNASSAKRSQPINPPPNLPDELRLKLVIVGDAPCGKTCLLIVFSKGVFPEVNVATVFENYVADVEVDGMHIELALWDTAGMDGYERLRPLSYPDSNVILICFSIDSPDSFDNIEEKWVPEVKHFCPGLPFILVGCKKDLRRDPWTIDELRKTNQRPVTTEEVCHPFLAPLLHPEYM